MVPPIRIGCAGEGGGVGAKQLVCCEQGEQWVSEAQSTSLGYRRVAAKTNERRTCIIIDRQRRSPPITRTFNNCTILQRAQGVLENTMAIRLRGELPLPSKNLFTLREYSS